MAPSKRAVPPPPGRKLDGGSGHKQSDSEAISEHLAAFVRGGGRIEKLGTTRVLQRIDPEPAAPTRRRR